MPEVMQNKRITMTTLVSTIFDIFALNLSHLSDKFACTPLFFCLKFLVNV